MTRKIAPARLNEFPDHYMQLEQMEERAGGASGDPAGAARALGQ